MWWKFPVLLGLVLSLCGIVPSFASDGAVVYESLKCGSCHKADKKTVAVPLIDIAKAYADRAKLIQFLRGESKPIIESEKWGMMRGQMKRIAPLQEQEKEALADYILSFK